jgi:tRNA1(Val) A37 N6-methylase TrmN6
MNKPVVKAQIIFMSDSEEENNVICRTVNETKHGKTVALLNNKFENCTFNFLFDLIITSPPYGIGKSYEKTSTLEEYTTWIEKIVPRLKSILKPTGAICWVYHFV